MAGPDDMPTPGLEPAFTLAAPLGSPVVIGRLATGGRRVYVPLAQGRFSGEGIEAEVMSGGETWLERPDGVTVVEASILVRTAAGDVLRLIGTGYRVDRTRMTIVFEADEDGPHAALTTRAFVAERTADGDLLAIERIT